MRPLTFLFLAALTACNAGSGATDTDASTGEATNPGATTGGTTGATTDVPTTGEPATSATTGLETTAASTTDPIDATTTTGVDPDTTAGTTAADATTDTTASTGTTDATTTPDTTTGESALDIAIFDAELYADCQPRVEPDPVGGTWYVGFENFAGLAETSATLVSASLSLADADPPVIEEISVTPKSSGPIPAGEQVDQKMAKLTGAMHSACDHCGEFYELVLTYDENGTIHEAVEDVTISCAF